MGAVYEAEHKLTGRRVAVKVLLRSAREHRVTLGRFANEGKHGTRVIHKNVAAVLDMGVDADTGDLYLVQELLQGQDVRALLEQRGMVTPREALDIVLPLLSALQFAHEQGVVHRDIKPDNVVLVTEPDGSLCPKLIDFGIAAAIAQDSPATRMTSTGAIIGTPTYMAPEQACGEKATPQVDIWAAGVLLYELLSGTVPYEDENAAVLFARLLTQRPPMLRTRLPGVSAELEAVVHRAIEPDRAQRYDSARAFREALLSLPAAALVIDRQRRAADVTLDESRDVRASSTLSPASVQRVGASRPQRATMGAAFALGAAILLLGGAWTAQTRSRAEAQAATRESAASAPRRGAEPVVRDPVVLEMATGPRVATADAGTAARTVAERPRTNADAGLARGEGAPRRRLNAVLRPIDSYPGGR